MVRARLIAGEAGATAEAAAAGDARRVSPFTVDTATLRVPKGWEAAAAEAAAVEAAEAAAVEAAEAASEAPETSGTVLKVVPSRLEEAFSAARTTAAGRALGSQPGPSPNAHRDQISRKEPKALATTKQQTRVPANHDARL